MANGLLNTTFEILPNKVDSIRRSSDPAGTLGSLMIQRGHLAFAGKPMTLRRSLPISRGHQTYSGKVLRIDRARQLLRGHLTMQGKSISFANATWSAIPDFLADRSLVPRFVPNVRVNWLVDPNALVTSVQLLGVDLAGVSYDAGNDRIVIATNPGFDTSDVLQLQATTSSGSLVLSNPFRLYVQTLPLNAAAGVEKFNELNVSIGYGGANDPQGAFLGQMGFGALDKWWPENLPEGVAVIPHAGGSFQITTVV